MLLVLLLVSGMLDLLFQLLLYVLFSAWLLAVSYARPQKREIFVLYSQIE